ncbi:MAG: hypothetical protein A2X86_20820 [Bdellovibrionales bacterium GWA2_49_15]|nr:MAG: hypothetical protein A2X86_20820 [Bdellovibrionales bacterium GWA2_49_15]HAZ13158.1 hypothetical protein [Bdellovibrionales bacterium]
MKMIMMVSMLLSTFSLSATGTEADRLACESFRAVHGARYTQIKTQADDFSIMVGPAHRSTQGFLKRALPSLQKLTKKYQQLLDHLPQQSPEEMRKVLTEEYSSLALKHLRSAGMLKLSAESCQGRVAYTCKIINDLFFTLDDTTPLTPKLTFKLYGIRYQSFGSTTVDVKDGNADIGTVFDPKIRSAQFELDKVILDNADQSIIENKRIELENARLMKRVSIQTRRQFIEAELTPEQRATCGDHRPVGKKVASHSRSREFIRAEGHALTYPASHVQQR